MKNWILKTFFSKELDDIRRHYYTEVIRAATKDVEETRIEDTDKKAKIIAEDMLSTMLSPVDWKHVISFDEKKGIIMVNGQRADEALLNNLCQEAEAITQFSLWKSLYETPKALAERAMFIEGDSIDTMKKGRAMLYCLTSQQKTIDILKAYRRTIDNKKGMIQ